MHFLYFFIFFCCAQLHGMGWSSFSIPPQNDVQGKRIYKSEKINFFALLNEADEKKAFDKVPELQSIDIKIIKSFATLQYTARLLYCYRLLQSANREELLEGIKLFDDFVAEKNFQLLDHYGMAEIAQSINGLIGKEEIVQNAYTRYLSIKPSVDLMSTSLKILCDNQDNQDIYKGLDNINELLAVTDESTAESSPFLLFKSSGIESMIKNLADNGNEYARATYGRLLATLCVWSSKYRCIDGTTYIHGEAPLFLKEAPRYLETQSKDQQLKEEINSIRGKGYNVLATACCIFEQLFSDTKQNNQKYFENAFNLGCFDAAFSSVGLYWTLINSHGDTARKYFKADLIRSFVEFLEEKAVTKNFSQFSVKDWRIENLLGKIYFFGDEWLSIKKDYRKAKKFLQPIADMETDTPEHLKVIHSAALTVATIMKSDFKKIKNAQFRNQCKAYYLKTVGTYPSVYYELSKLYYHENDYQKAAEMFLNMPDPEEFNSPKELEHISHILKLSVQSKIDKQTFNNLAKKYKELVPNPEEDLQRAETIFSILEQYTNHQKDWDLFKGVATSAFKKLMLLTDKDPKLMKNRNFRKKMENLKSHYCINDENQMIELKKQITKK